MNHCLADCSGPFYRIDKPFRNWSSLPFSQLDTPHPPFVDHDHLDEAIRRAQQYLGQIHAQQYSGIVIDNLAHLVTFAYAHEQVYPHASPERQRAMAYQDAFRTLFNTANDLGLDVFVTTDMQWSTPALRRYVGRLHPNNPRLAQVNRWALEELFQLFPQVRGLVVRVGETGGAHNLPGSYAGHMLYTSVGSLRQLLGTLLPVCEQHDRLLILRTWSIGIGELGDMLWSPERYQAVFAGFDSPHMLASVKHGPGDFFRMAPHNPTIGLAGPRQLIELQNRREYELFGMVPSAIAQLHQGVFGHAATTITCAGVWAWNGTGGWGGGTAALGADGWSTWTALNSALTAALYHDPQCDATGFAWQWCSERYGAEAGAALAAIYLASEGWFERGWYAGVPDRVRIGKLYVPPLLWIWWMRPAAVPLIWVYLAATHLHAPVLDGGAQVLAEIDEHLAHLREVATPESEPLLESIVYMRDVFLVAHAIRSLLLQASAAALANDQIAWQRQIEQIDATRTLLLGHQERWRDRADFPPLELDEILAFLRSFQRRPGWMWRHFQLAAALIRPTIAKRWPGRRSTALGAGAAVLALLVASVRRPHIGIGMLLAVIMAGMFRRQVAQWALPRLSRRYYVLPSIFFETGPAISEWVEG